MKRIVLAACLAALALYGCKKDSKPAEGGGGGATTTATGTTGGKGTAPTEPPKADEPKNPEGCNSDFAQPFVADATLTEKCSPYTLKTGNLNVDGYMLTIEPGVELKLPDHAQLSVSYYKAARLVVKGTKEKPVKFTGRTWKGLHLHPDSGGSSLENLVLEGAGEDDSAAFHTETYDVTVNGLTITGAKKTAVRLDVDRPLKGFTAVDLSKASEDPGELVHTSAKTAGVLKADSQFPEKAAIWLEGAIDNDVTLALAGPVYRAAQHLNVDAPEGKSASLTLKEGVTLELGENVALSVGYYRGPAGFKALGTKEKPVTITRWGEDKVATPSEGLGLYSGARAPELDYLVLEYAGRADAPMLKYSETMGLGKVTNSTFRHTKGTALHVEAAKERFTAFDGNRFEDVEGPALKVPLELAHGLGAGNTFSEQARVTLVGAAHKDTTLANLGAPYVVEGDLHVDGEETKPAGLTLEPGTSLLFTDNGKLTVGYYNPAKLTAVGTAEKGISLGKLLTGWQGVSVHGKAVVTLENVTLSGTDDEVNPLNVIDEVSGSVKKLALKGTKKGAMICSEKVKLDGLSADKGVAAREKCP